MGAVIAGTVWVEGAEAMKAVITWAVEAGEAAVVAVEDTIDGRGGVCEVL